MPPPLPQLRLPVCLHLHTVVLSGHGVCGQLALPPSTRVLVLDNVMRDARTLSLATMVRLAGCGCVFGESQKRGRSGSVRCIQT